MMMNNQIIYVVTNPTYGWDCVFGCFSSRELAVEYLQDVFEEFQEEHSHKYDFDEFLEISHYIIHEKILK